MVVVWGDLSDSFECSLLWTRIDKKIYSMISILYLSFKLYIKKNTGDNMA